MKILYIKLQSPAMNKKKSRFNLQIFYATSIWQVTFFMKESTRTFKSDPRSSRLIDIRRARHKRNSLKVYRPSFVYFLAIYRRAIVRFRSEEDR